MLQKFLLLGRSRVVVPNKQHQQWNESVLPRSEQEAENSAEFVECEAVVGSSWQQQQQKQQSTALARVKSLLCLFFPVFLRPPDELGKY